MHDRAAFNVTSVLSVRGGLGPARLAAAIEAVARRHEALRTFFFPDPDTGEHMQGVFAENDARLCPELGGGPVRDEAEVSLAIQVCLERVSAATGLPVWIYRPSSITGDEASELDLMSNVVRYSRMIGAAPDLDVGGGAWRASLDLARIEAVATKIVSEVIASNQINIHENAGVRYIRESGDVRVDACRLKELMLTEESSTSAKWWWWGPCFAHDAHRSLG